MYANDDPNGRFPPISDVRGMLMYPRKNMSLEYLVSGFAQICPDDEDLAAERARPETDPVLIDDWSYFYVGYALRDDADVEGFADAYKRGVVQENRDKNIDLTDSAGHPRVLRRLKIGVEGAFADPLADQGSKANAASIASHMPIMIERVGNHHPDGANVLYLNGNVKFIRYPGEWPMTPKTVRLLQELDALGAPARPH